MSTTKVINHLSVDNLNLNEVLSQQDKFFVNDDLILIFNGNVQRIPVFSKEEIYQMGTSSELCHWLHFFRSMRNADGQTGAVFLLVKSGWARCPA